jgi:chaperonin cofactor prefoldin
MTKKHNFFHIAEFARNAWVIVAAAVGIIFWAAKQESSLADIQENKAKIGLLESRITVLESGLNKLSVKIDDIKEDLKLIKSAVLK